MTNPKIAVIGSGANGSAIAADLTTADCDVVLIEQWPEHVRAMRADGLRIEMPDQTVAVPVRAYDLCDVCTFREKFDVVLVGMKAYDTRWACQLLEPYLKPEALVAGVQNGMTMDTVAEVVGPHRTMGCVVEVTGMMTAPGVVARQTPPDRSWFAVGSMSPETVGRESEIADLLGLAGKVAIVDDIRAAKWMKLISNCIIMVTTAILGGPVLASLTLPGMRELMLSSGQEALDLATTLGYPVLPIFGLEPEDLEERDHVVETLLDTLCGEFTLPTTTTTVLYDWRHGRHSEVDDVNGLVAAEYVRLSGRAPVNEAIVEVAHRIERGELAPDPANHAVLSELAAAIDVASGTASVA